MINIYSNLTDTPLETLIEQISALSVDRMFINNPYMPAVNLSNALAALPPGRTFRNHFKTPVSVLEAALPALALNTYFLNCPLTSAADLCRVLRALPEGASFTNHPSTPIATLTAALQALPPGRIFTNHPSTSLEYLRTALAALAEDTCFVNHSRTPEDILTQALIALPAKVLHISGTLAKKPSSHSVNVFAQSSDSTSILSSKSEEVKPKQNDENSSAQAALANHTMFKLTASEQSGQNEEDLTLSKKPRYK